MSPRLKRLLRGRAFSDYYWTNAMLADRSVLEEGDFGAVAPYVCDVCGPQWVGYTSHMHSRGDWEGPGEYTYTCDLCGHSEVGEHTDPILSFTAMRRFTITLRHLENAA